MNTSYKVGVRDLRLGGGCNSSDIVMLIAGLASDLGLEYPSTEGGVLNIPFPTEELESVRFRDAYLLSEVLSKFPFVLSGLDRSEVAIRRFVECEEDCSLTNSTVRVSTVGPNGLDWHTVISTARAKILHLLGPFSWDQAEDHFSFGPGATTARKRTEADAIHKIGYKPDVTNDCSLLSWCAVYRVPRWFEILSGSLPSGSWVEDLGRFPPEAIFNLVPGNRVVTVPKNAKTDRVIAIEPCMNMYVQKGLGSLIRSRLRRVGIDLNDQTPNQRLAREGSKSGLLATIDLSAASDTISRELVELLLPDDWCTALKQCRSPVGVLPDGSVVNYQKFSSMGNGATFELESLIFWGLCSAVCQLESARAGFDGKAVLQVYGDDIIVETKYEVPIVWALHRAGFTVNVKKTFFRGPFRESCGKHYWNGEDVTPFYIRNQIHTVFDLYKVANRLREWARLSWGLDARCQRTYERIVALVPSRYRLLIPDGIGDVGFVTDHDAAVPVLDKKLKRRGINRWRCNGLLPLVNRRNYDGYNVLVKWFLLRKRDALERSVGTLQRTVLDRAVRHVFRVEQWPSWGPWL